jgi:hypothetical protein
VSVAGREDHGGAAARRHVGEAGGCQALMGVLDAFEGCLDAEIVGLQAMAALARDDKENQVGESTLLSLFILILCIIIHNDDNHHGGAGRPSRDASTPRSWGCRPWPHSPGTMRR